MSMKTEKSVIFGVIAAIGILIASVLIQIYADNRIATLTKMVEESDRTIDDLKTKLEVNRDGTRSKGEIEAIIAENKALSAQVAWHTAKLLKNTKSADFDESFEKISKRINLINKNGLPLLLNVRFEGGSSQVPIAYHDLLKEISDILKQNSKGWTLLIEGSSDQILEDRSTEQERKSTILAIERAYTTGMFLIANGVPCDKIKFKGSLNGKKCAEIFFVPL